MDFAGISTLKSIKLRAYRHSVVESTKKIQDEQPDYGNYDMVLIEEETLYIYKVPFHIEIDLELARITASNSS
nr:putative late blight resistance protein homolog R1B-16 isoform X1 [Ipomoea trifida]